MVDYKNAARALASGIESTQRELNRDGKLSIAEEMLKHGPENHSNWSNLELNLSQESIGNLQEYHGNLQRAYSEEIGKGIKQTMERVEEVTDLRERLHSELNRVLDETRELEEIAERLQDSGIGNVAGKEERQVRELGKNLEKLDSKGEDLEKLENRLESLLDSHNLDKEDLHEELGRRAEAVEKILDSAGSTGGGKADLDQIANTIIQEESKLQKAKSRGLQQLEDDIKTLSSIVKLEEQEISALRQIEKYLQKGKLSQASSTLDSLIQKRENFGDQSRAVQQIKQGLQEEKKIIMALQEFFDSINQLENKDIPRDRLYQKMESKGSFSSAQEAKDFFTGLESEFEDIEQDIVRVKKLEQKERKLENLEYDKLKEIDDEDAQLRQRATGQEINHLQEIHEKLQELGFCLENEVTKPSSGSSSGSNGGGGSNSSSGSGGPSGGDPWIVSLSDIESWPGFLEHSLKLVNKNHKNIIDFSSQNPVWSGNNYKLVINGDLVQHGRHGGSQETKRLIEMLRSIVNSAESQTRDGVHPVQFTVGNHDPNLFFGDATAFPKPDEMGPVRDKNFVQTYRDWINQGIVRMAIPGHNYTYVHAGQAHQWTADEVRRANEALENIDFSFSGRISNPDHNMLQQKSIDQIDTTNLSEKAIIQSIDRKERSELKKILNLDDSQFNDDAIYRHGYKGDLEKELDRSTALEALENANQLGLNRIKFKDVNKDNLYAKLLGVGASGGSSGDNIHAGLTWARDGYVKYGPPQIVGHSGHEEPTRKGNIIVENTSAYKKNKASNYSVVVETSNGVFALVGDQSGNSSRKSL